jgi:hypothetical protein
MVRGHEQGRDEVTGDLGHPAAGPGQDVVADQGDLMYLTIVRRTATLVALPVLLTTLAACNSASGAQTTTGTAAPAGIGVTRAASPTPQNSASATTQAVAPATRWAGTSQFLQIKSAGKADGVEYLEVRRARQKSAGENLETVTLGGPWIKVPISAQAENVPMQGNGGDFGQLSAALAERSAGESDQGFDVAFDQEGQVGKVTWLYLSSRERTKAALEGWAGNTEFLQIKSARQRGGVTYLKVRPAEKEYLGESFDTITIGGPWTEVVMSALGENVPLRGAPGDADALRTMLAKRRAIEIDEGFDISFFGNGQVSKVTWLYGPSF